MRRAPQVPVTIIAKDSCFGNDRLGVAADAVHQAQYMVTSQTAGIPTKLQLAVGMVVVLTCNIDTEIRLVNGQWGEVLGWDVDEVGSVTNVHLTFFDVTAGQRRKSVHNRFGSQAVPIGVHSVTFELGSGRKVTRMGFPLVPATAITIHKSQGQTYAQHGVDLRGVFCSGQAYVGEGRAGMEPA